MFMLVPMSKLNDSIASMEQSPMMNRIPPIIQNQGIVAPPNINMNIGGVNNFKGSRLSYGSQKSNDTSINQINQIRSGIQSL